MRGQKQMLWSSIWTLLSAVAAEAYSALASSSTAPISVVVVGGGPIGLATAITLSRPPHSCQVTVLERQEGNGQAKYDPTRSYLYNVNPRGLLWFDRHLKTSNHLDSTEPDDQLFLQLTQKGSATTQGMGNIMIVPADPNVPLPAPRPVTLGTGNATVLMKRSYWIPRHQMVEILQEECHRHNVTLLHGKQFQSLSANETSVTVSCADGSDYTASLLVAADGYESPVREYLLQCKSEDWCAAPQWKVRRYKSPATGVKLKALQFPPNFTIPNGTESFVTDSEGIYVVRGTKDGSRTRLGLGFLPVKDPNLVRPANTNTRPDHLIWSLQDGPSMKQYFQENFPRFEWDNYVSEEEWERFSQAKGTSFPFCQYSTGAAVWSLSGNAGVVLVGDACHAFPPDIGQGINAGLQDIVALDQSLRGEDINTRVMETSGESSTPVTPPPLSSALAAYQENRVAEHRALIRLARFGAPYQYRQPWLRDRLGRLFWSMNVALRLLLSKMLPTVCPPPAVLLTNSRPDLTFRQVMRHADTLTLVLQVLALQVLGLRLGLLKAKWLLSSWISTVALYAASRLVRNTNKAA
ncbi:hypothetical protein FisN_16Lh154 [Fistulifera solaris]|uniref:FAD-binding domain-containing protein n=1 Tax=Fistulifera solaris TaxID=1519565 RepID=A0A1Z5KJ85_FISSO|nr:hypothetical protein FisN_16Lh154 [Fistulifera solaris]|eukprot:GAX26316.1 hypothetical protein FisN_16Lh154 [Fistulifera solaris]